MTYHRHKLSWPANSECTPTSPLGHLNTSLVYRLVSYVYPGRSKELLDELQKKKMTVLGTAA